jgi:hypothetical protein
MEIGRSWEAAGRSDSQEFLNIFVEPESSLAC